MEERKRAGQPRAAQVWAVEVAGGINNVVKAGKSLPFQLELKGYGKGQAIRFCQEVNYAKKRQEELERELFLLRKASGEAGYLSEPVGLVWALSYRMVGEEAIFIVGLPASRARAQTEVTKQFSFEAGNLLSQMEQDLLGEKQKDTPKVRPIDDILEDFLKG